MSAVRPSVRRFSCTTEQNCMAVLVCFSGGPAVTQSPVTSDTFYHFVPPSPSVRTSRQEFQTPEVGRSSEVLVEKSALQSISEDVEEVSPSEGLQKGSKNEQTW